MIGPEGDFSESEIRLAKQKGFLPVTEKYADTVLSIPLYNGMTDDEQSYVIECMNNFR